MEKYLKIKSSVKYIDVSHKMKVIILDSRKDQSKKAPFILWIHGGGYSLGMPEMVYASRVRDLLKRYELVVASPAYTLSYKAPYPAALKDCYQTLLYAKNNSLELGIDTNKMMIGGESAGGGLALAVGIYARDQKEVDLKYMFPLYPMIDCDDTVSSKNNHALVWNTRRNHRAWRRYLRETKDIDPYVSPAKLADFTGLAPFYTFVADGEPFYYEAVNFTERAKKAGIDAKCDVYHSRTHAFDLYYPWSKNGKLVKKRFIENYDYVNKKYL